MAFLFRNKQKMVLDTTRSAKELLQKLDTVDQLPPAVSAVLRWPQQRGWTVQLTTKPI
jgi:hypothetical protein